MTKGLKFWKDPKRYCRQDNDVAEKNRRDAINYCIDLIEKDYPELNLAKYRGKGIFEGCGVVSIYNGQDCRGDIDKYGDPEWMDITCEPSSFMFNHLNWPKNDNIYQKGSAMDNRYIYSQEKMLQKMGYQTEVVKEPSPAFFKRHLPKNHACVINIPKHYCCAIAWDYLKGELIYHNPWPGDKRNKNNGRFERIAVKTWIKIPIKYSLAFWKD
jgi:hypothetical protein